MNALTAITNLIIQYAFGLIYGLFWFYWWTVCYLTVFVSETRNGRFDDRNAFNMMSDRPLWQIFAILWSLSAAAFVVCQLKKCEKI